MTSYEGHVVSIADIAGFTPFRHFLPRQKALTVSQAPQVSDSPQDCLKLLLSRAVSVSCQSQNVHILRQPMLS